MTSEQPILKADQVHKSFAQPTLQATPLHVLRGLSLEVYAGEKIAIMGKSGEGKSTLLHILGSLEQPTSGHLELCGKSYGDIALPSLRCDQIGFVFQAYNLLEEYTTLEN